MRLPNIDFRNIRPHRNSQNDGFEELTRQLVLAEPPAGYESIENRGAGADGGVEIAVKFSDGRVWGWQSKYFLDSFASSEVAQLKKSFKAALKTFDKLEVYCVAIPRNLSGHAEGRSNTQTTNWNKFKTWCADECSKLGQEVKIELWDESYFIHKLQTDNSIYAGMLHYWFDQRLFTNNWFKAKLEKSVASIGKRYRPNDHVDLEIAKTIQVLKCDTNFESRVKDVSNYVTDAINIVQSLIIIGGIDSDLAHSINMLREQLLSYNSILKDYDLKKIDRKYLCETVHNIVGLESENLSYQALLKEFYKLSKKSDDKTEEEKRQLTDITQKISNLFSVLDKAIVIFSETDIKLLQAPVLLLEGDAGVGKSHLLADEVKSHIESGKPALFIPARIIRDGDKPEQEILSYLDLGDCAFETFLAILDTAALTCGRPALIFIDGINESLNAKGWVNGLPSFIAQIQKFENIALCVSIRSCYKKFYIQKDLPINSITHYGFMGNLGRAATQYLDNNGIERPTAPIFGLSQMFYNPLFLSTAVDFMKAKHLTSFPRGLDSFNNLMEFWIEAVEHQLVNNNNFSRIAIGDKKIYKALCNIAAEMAKIGSEYIPYEAAYSICEKVVDLAQPREPSERFLQRLIDEGVLLDWPDEHSDDGKQILFGFQKFGDYFIAKSIIDDCKTVENLAVELKENGQYAYLFSPENSDAFTGIRIAFLALVAIRFGIELPLIETDFQKNVFIPISDFIDSLLWRNGQHIFKETVNLLDEIKQAENDAEPVIDERHYFDLLIELALTPNCLLNASYLKTYLASFSLGERDAKWSVYLVGKFNAHENDWSVITQLIDWAWLAPKAEIEQEKIYLAATVLALMTSTMDRKLRDCATKALASLLIKYPSEISKLIEKFANWDDSYVRERVLAAAAAGVLYSNDLTILKAAAIAADNMVFNKTPIERHAWTRRYGQIIINHADINNAGIDKTIIERATPPYASEQIHTWPSLAQVAPWRDVAGSIFRSVIGYVSNPYDGKMPNMAGDFGRYTMGGISTFFSDDVRGPNLPFTSKQKTNQFWEKVDALGKAACDAHTNLIVLNEKRNKVNTIQLLKLANREPVSLKDYDEKGKIDVQAAENAFLALLPVELQTQYDLLQPLRNNHDSLSNFPLLQAQCWVFNRALELGWQQSLHENIEKEHPFNVSIERSEHRVERIGKKYQHIAYGELIGYLADYHWACDYDKTPYILGCLDDYERADIDPTYLCGEFSKAPETEFPDAICLPKMDFVVDTPQNNIAWSKSQDDIPDLKQFLVQASKEGQKWCLQHCFVKDENFLEGFDSGELIKSMQYGIELILVAKNDLEKLQKLATKKIDENSHDIFSYDYSTANFFGQRSFKHQKSVPTFSLDYSVADFNFGRIVDTCSPKYSDYDYSGLSDSNNFPTPHPALLAELKLKPKNAWSKDFVAEDGSLVFCTKSFSFGDLTFIRQDVIESFAKSHDLKVVWRVYVEKYGGLGENRKVGISENISRKDYIGYYYEKSGCWFGKLMIFRD